MKSKSLILTSVIVALAMVMGLVQVTPARAAGITWTVDAALADDSLCTAAGGYQCKTIQAAINASTDGDVIQVASGTYIENLLVNKEITLAGAGQGSSFILPAVSAPVCVGGSLCAGSSNIILVQANNVTIHGFTLDGDNPTLTSGVVVSGADLDARNGVITNHPLGVFNNLTIYSTTVKNIYLRGIYASSYGSFNFHHNVVENVNGESQSIAMMNFGGTGIFANNVVSNVNDGIVSNWSKGTQYLNNTVTDASSGIHTDNNQTTGDLLLGNTISNCKTDGYGLFVFAPFVSATIKANTITDCAVGIAVSGQNAVATPVFIDNRVDGGGVAGSVGVYITNDMWGWGFTNVSANFQGNTIINNDTGIYLEQIDTNQVNVTFNNNNISGNTVHGIEAAGIVAADATYNWWGSAAGPGGSNNDVLGSVIDVDPWAVALISSTTASTHEVGETGTLDTHVTVSGLYGVQFVVEHDNAVLNFLSGAMNDLTALGWYWDYVIWNFNTTVTGQTRLASSMQSPHTPATLTGQSMATWTYTCAAPGTSALTYDTTAGTGTYLADMNGFEIPAAMTGDSITCIQSTASVEGYIKLQGRRGTDLNPRAWHGAAVTLTCASAECAGFGPYVMTTDDSGHYQLLKTGAGSGVALGTYTAAVSRRAYLGATKVTDVTIVAGNNVINPVDTAPILLGGDATEDGVINIGDLGIIGGAFGTTITADTGPDINGDGFVNIFDLVLAGSNFNGVSSTWLP